MILISPLKTLSNHPRHKKPEFKSLDDLYFRIEHERTLTVDEDTAAFFIDVEVLPLKTVFHLKNEYKNLIKDSINSMSENLLAYKNLEEIKEMINGTQILFLVYGKLLETITEIMDRLKLKLAKIKSVVSSLNLSTAQENNINQKILEN